MTDSVREARRMPAPVVLLVGMGLGIILGVWGARRGYDSVEPLAKREAARQPPSKVAGLVKPPAGVPATKSVTFNFPVGKAEPKPVYVFEGFHKETDDSTTRRFTIEDDWSFKAECPRGTLESVYLFDASPLKTRGVWMKDVNFHLRSFTGNNATGGTFVLTIRCNGAWKISVYQHAKTVN